MSFINSRFPRKPLTLNGKPMRRTNLSRAISILALLFFSSCALLEEYVDPGQPKKRDKQKFSIQTADRGELISELKKAKKNIKILQKQKDILIKQNQNLSNEVSSLKIKLLESQAMEGEKRKRDPGVGLAIPRNKGTEFTEYEYHDMGVKAFNQERYDDALANFNKAIGINPKFYEAFTNLGVVYMTLGNYEKSVTLFNKALELNDRFKPAISYKKKAEEILNSKREKAGGQSLNPSGAFGGGAPPRAY